MNDISKIESERELIDRAKRAISKASWELGECASLWMKRYSRGRGDNVFADIVSLTPDQVFQRRVIWDLFGNLICDYSNLTWGHFLAVKNILNDQMFSCLQWADDVQSSVSEMMAWYRANKKDE